MSKPRDLVVIGGGGVQAGAMFAAAARGGHIGAWAAVDRSWRPERRQAVEALGIEALTMDAFSNADELRDLLSTARLVVNFAGPYYRTGGIVLDACIATGTDYLDICDDADATLELLERDEAARAAGVRALIGMGSSPGSLNVFVRLAVDALGSADDVEIAWTADVADYGPAVMQHMWHICSIVDADGSRRPVPSWEDLGLRTVRFPDPVGDCLVMELSHPEPITLPRFLPVKRATNHGGIRPDDSLVLCWALARLGAASVGEIDIGGRQVAIPDVAATLFERYRQSLGERERLWGGFQIDVHTGGDGYRLASGADTSMEESTGTPAAAGIALMLEGAVPEPGVFPPERLEPAAVLPALGRVSRGKGSFAAHRVEGGVPTERLRLRDLLEIRPAGARSAT